MALERANWGKAVAAFLNDRRKCDIRLLRRHHRWPVQRPTRSTLTGCYSMALEAAHKNEAAAAPASCLQKKQSRLVNQWVLQDRKEPRLSLSTEAALEAARCMYCSCVAASGAAECADAVPQGRGVPHSVGLDLFVNRTLETSALHRRGPEIPDGLQDGWDSVLCAHPRAHLLRPLDYRSVAHAPLHRLTKLDRVHSLELLLKAHSNA
mmetsp:Transcript_68793/g.191611  ORF Transcript_68793/g.191611 Transcript_68793/m.191611 type:complete len:208 (-) Transcript_68793:376-999(-)